MTQQIPAMGEVEDIGLLRPVFYQSGRMVHGPYGMQLQPIDADLTAISAMTGTGIATRTGANTWALRTITGTANEITVTNGSGASGNPTLVLSGNISAAKAFRRGNVLGTVSQSGGTPTGALIEAGSNANGQYTRFADGTQICTNTLAASATGSVTWTFPAAFSSTTNLTPTGSYIAAGDPHTANPIFIQYGTLTTTTVLFSARRSDTGAAQTVNARHTAIGRWF
jgi:hypothetical protein